MSEPFRRDSLITVIGLTVVVGAFFFGFVVPGISRRKVIDAEIAAISAEIGQIPQKVAELESLKTQLRTTEEFLDETSRLIPIDANDHPIVKHVAQLAEQNNLRGTRLQPASSQELNTFTIQTFQVELSGDYRGILQFLKGIEEQERLVSITELSLERQDGRNAGGVLVRITFAVYSQFSDLGGGGGFVSADI